MVEHRLRYSLLNLQISIDNYIYNKIECNELNVLIPFSNNQSGAVTKTKTTLKFVSETVLPDSSRSDCKLQFTF